MADFQNFCASQYTVTNEARYILIGQNLFSTKTHFCFCFSVNQKIFPRRHQVDQWSAGKIKNKLGRPVGEKCIEKNNILGGNNVSTAFWLFFHTKCVLFSLGFS